MTTTPRGARSGIIALNFDAVERAIKRVPGLDQAAQRLADQLQQAILNGGERVRGVADALHGTRIGHPLHPALTDIPIGAWSMAVLFDLISLVPGTYRMRRAADMLHVVGVVAAVPTAMAGAADYSGIHRDAAAEALTHAVLNMVGLTAFLGSLVARTTGHRKLGIGAGVVGLSFVYISASLGADLIYRRRVGVDHAHEVPGETGWFPVADVADLHEGVVRPVSVGERQLLIGRLSGDIVAMHAVCSHAGGPLADGEIEGTCVTCPWHYSVFDLRDGAVVHGPATQPQPTYPTRVHNDKIEVLFGGDQEISAS